MTSSSAARAAKEAKPVAIVVGAGIAGLSAAFYLAESGYQVTVYEKESAAGGNLGATRGHPTLAKATDLGDVFEVYPHMFGDWYHNFWFMMKAIGRGKHEKYISESGHEKYIWRRMDAFKFLPKPTTPERRFHPRYQTLRNNGSLQTLWANLFAGILPLPDMILAGYAALGLLSEDFKDSDELNVATLNDFLNTRFYGSKYVTQFYQMIILYIWSLEPDQSSIYACQRFFQYQFKRPSPSAWVLRSGDAYTSIIEPLVNFLQSKWKVTFKFNSPVVAASLNQEHNAVDQLLVIENKSDLSGYKLIPQHPGTSAAAVYVFALPPETLAALVQTPIPADIGRRGDAVDCQSVLRPNRYGIITNFLLDPLPSPLPPSSGLDDEHSDPMAAESDGVTISESASSADDCPVQPRSPASPAPQTPARTAIGEAIPDVVFAKTLSSEPIPVLYVGFKQGAEINRLIPEHCYVGLTDSKYALTFVEVTQEFKLANAQCNSATDVVDTVIALAASDYGELPIFRTPVAQQDRPLTSSSTASVAELQQSLEERSKTLLLNEARQYLPFTDDDVVWSFFRTNQNHRLFLNDVDSARNPMKTVYRRDPNSAPLIKNIAFAGDYCSQDVVMSTVEAAVESGFRAGMELENNHNHAPTRRPVTLQPHSAYPKPLIASLKLMLLPSMVLVKSWSDLNHCAEEARHGISEPQRFEKDVLPLLLTYWPRQASMVLGATQDAMNTMSSLATESFLTTSKLYWSFFNLR